MNVLFYFLIESFIERNKIFLESALPTIANFRHRNVSPNKRIRMDAVCGTKQYSIKTDIYR